MCALVLQSITNTRETTTLFTPRCVSVVLEEVFETPHVFAAKMSLDRQNVEEEAINSPRRRFGWFWLKSRNSFAASNLNLQTVRFILGNYQIIGYT